MKHKKFVKKVFFNTIVLIALSATILVGTGMSKPKGNYSSPQVSPTIQNQSISNTVTAKQEIKSLSFFSTKAESKTAINRIDIEEAKMLFDSGKALFIDARGESEYKQGHIKGAISMPVNLANERIKENVKKIKNKILITYCHGVRCHLSDKVAYKLYDAGYKKVIIFFGGWPKWNEHNYSIDAVQEPQKQQTKKSNLKGEVK